MMTNAKILSYNRFEAFYTSNTKVSCYSYSDINGYKVKSYSGDTCSEK